MTQSIKDFIATLEEHYGHEQQYLDIVKQEGANIAPLLAEKPEWLANKVFERLCIPDRVISFRVAWLNDENQVEVNRGWRVQQSNGIGPYKGGLRFASGVNESTLKALAVEQCFKNALTGFPIGGAKGGADFDPKGRSDHEIMRFCQAFMSELHRHIGPNIDVPAGDINVGSEEIGFLFGHYKRIVNQFEGAITGKHLAFGGSQVRVEATGFGVIYYTEALLEAHDAKIQDQRIAISGAGNVALHAALKAIELDASVITLSNSRGTLVSDDGFTDKHIDWIIQHKRSADNVLQDAAAEFDLSFRKEHKAWENPCDIAIPCATQNELNEDDLKQLSDNGCEFIVEGSNMALTDGAIEQVKQQKLLFAPGKAANAGGVALSAMEMGQNASFNTQTFDVLDEQLQHTMQSIFKQCHHYGTRYADHPDYIQGASIAGFSRLAEAIMAQGV